MKCALPTDLGYGDIWWPLMAFSNFSWQNHVIYHDISWHIMNCHDISTTNSERWRTGNKNKNGNRLMLYAQASDIALLRFCFSWVEYKTILGNLFCMKVYKVKKQLTPAICEIILWSPFFLEMRNQIQSLAGALLKLYALGGHSSGKFMLQNRHILTVSKSHSLNRNLQRQNLPHHCGSVSTLCSQSRSNNCKVWNVSSISCVENCPTPSPRWAIIMSASSTNNPMSPDSALEVQHL